MEAITPADKPWPMPFRLMGKAYNGDEVEEWIDPERIAYWAHCESGLSADAVIEWLRGELELLEAIDPHCDK
jgi:hypothetical protein